MCHCLKLPFVAVQWKLPARNASWPQAISSGRLDWRRRDLRGPSDYNSSDKWQSLAKQFVSRLRAEKKNHRNLNLERFCRSVCLIWAPKHIKKHFAVKSAYSSVEVCRLCWWFLTFSKEFFLNEIFQWIEFNELELLKITQNCDLSTWLDWYFTWKTVNLSRSVAMSAFSAAQCFRNGIMHSTRWHFSFRV